jgi:hypothetical protein
LYFPRFKKLGSINKKLGSINGLLSYLRKVPASVIPADGCAASSVQSDPISSPKYF